MVALKWRANIELGPKSIGKETRAIAQIMSAYLINIVLFCLDFFFETFLFNLSEIKFYILKYSDFFFLSENMRFQGTFQL